MEHFAGFRDSILDRAEAADWPPVIVAGVGCIETNAAWIVAVELATTVELIVLSRALATADA